MRYRCMIELDAGKFNSAANAVLDNVNTLMHEMGFDETLKAITTIPINVFEVSEKLTPAQQQKVTEMLHDSSKNIKGYISSWVEVY